MEANCKTAFRSCGKSNIITPALRLRGIEVRRGRGQRRNDQDYVRWCFANREDAEAFVKRFGGVSFQASYVAS